ncbi:UNVERIFIED_CONTAM: Synergin gamma [Trichonephila clavipes]
MRVESLPNSPVLPFFSNTLFLSHLPKEASLEFSSAVLSSNVEDNRKACGLCLLNIEMKSKFGKEETLNLSYGGRNYHSTCANLWVNCVDPLLPALPLPQLL